MAILDITDLPEHERPQAIHRELPRRRTPSEEADHRAAVLAEADRRNAENNPPARHPDEVRREWLRDPEHRMSELGRWLLTSPESFKVASFGPDGSVDDPDGLIPQMQAQHEAKTGHPSALPLILKLG